MTDVTYPPLDVLKPVATDVWIVDSGPLRALGLPLPVRMTVIRLASGAMLLHSPTHFDTHLRIDIERLGPIAHLVAPSSVHWLSVKAWQRELSQATTWGASGLRERGPVRRANLHLDRDLGPVAPPDWADEIQHVVVPGAAASSK